ncbi:MAG: hypothetical protein MI673_07185 [Thiotrichales bacterium]|nr:hypothetical protein [Thiotrichales bacterium]
MTAIQPIRTGLANSGRLKITLLILALASIASTLVFTTVLSDRPSAELWGFLVANFIFLLGLSQYGVAFSAIMRICGAGWARAYYRVAECFTLAFMPIAIGGFLYIYCFGSEHIFYWLEPAADAHHSPWLDHDSLLYRNLIAQLVFYLIAGIYFLMGLLPDINVQDAETGPAWRQWLYRRLLAMKQGRDEQALKRNVYLYSPVILLAVVIPNTFIAWDFGMMLIPHYHSTVFPMYFIMGNMFAGSAALLVIVVLLSRFIALDQYFRTIHVHSMGILLTGFALFWLYFFWAQFFVSWFGNLPHEYGVLSVQMYDHYAPVFWLMISCNFILPIACLIFLRVKQTWWAMTVVAVVINLGIWLNRYLIVVPALSAEHYPLSSFAEISMTIGLVTGFLFLLLLMFNSLPVVSMWELRAMDEEQANSI